MGFALWCAATAFGAWLWIQANRRLLGDSFSPLNLLLFSWLGPLAMSCLRLSELQRPWSLEVWMVIGWTTLALVGLSAAAATRIAPNPLFAETDLGPLVEEW